MHMYVHCSPVYNSKDLEPTQMPINDRLNKENVVHIHYGILRSHKKRWVRVLCRDMDEPGNHHSQQTDPRTESQAPYVLTHKCELNNENTWTQGGKHHTVGPVRGYGGRGGSAVADLGRSWSPPPRWHSKCCILQRGQHCCPWGRQVKGGMQMHPFMTNPLLRLQHWFIYEGGALIAYLPLNDLTS